MTSPNTEGQPNSEDPGRRLLAIATGTALTDEQRSLIDRNDSWWEGYRAGCQASHSIACDSVRAERDHLAAKLTEVRRATEQRIADLQAEMARQVTVLERRPTRLAQRVLPQLERTRAETDACSPHRRALDFLIKDVRRHLPADDPR